LGFTYIYKDINYDLSLYGLGLSLLHVGPGPSFMIV